MDVCARTRFYPRSRPRQRREGGTMSALVEMPGSTALPRLDELVARLREGAPKWAQLPIAEKIAIARRMQQGYLRIAERSVLAACAKKGIAPGTPQEGEEWLAGPY